MWWKVGMAKVSYEIKCTYNFGNVVGSCFTVVLWCHCVYDALMLG